MTGIWVYYFHPTFTLGLHRRAIAVQCGQNANPCCDSFSGLLQCCFLCANVHCKCWLCRNMNQDTATQDWHPIDSYNMHLPLHMTHLECLPHGVPEHNGQSSRVCKLCLDYSMYPAQGQLVGVEICGRVQVNCILTTGEVSGRFNRNAWQKSRSGITSCSVLFR